MDEERVPARSTRRAVGGRWLAASLAGLVGGVALGAGSAAGASSGAGGWSFWLENVGGPWIAVAFAVGALSRRRLPGSLAGLVAMISAVTLYDLSKGIPFVRPLWLVVGVTVGVIFGALGGWWGERRVGAWVPAGLTGGVLVGEVLALSVGGLPHPMFSSRLAVVQAIVGLAGASLLGWRRDWWRAAALTAAVSGVIGLVEVATGWPTRLIW